MKYLFTLIVAVGLMCTASSAEAGTRGIFWRMGRTYVVAKRDFRRSGGHVPAPGPLLRRGPGLIGQLTFRPQGLF